MSKKILIACMLVMTMILSFATIGHAATTTTIVVSDATGTPGETFTIDIAVEGNEGFCTVQGKLAYDKDAFTLIKTEETGDCFLGEIHSPTLTQNPYPMAWGDGTDEEDFYDDVTMTTLTFLVNEDAAAGDYTFEFTQIQAVSLEGNDVSGMTATAGTVTVSGTLNKKVWYGYKNHDATAKTFLAIAKAPGASDYGIIYDGYELAGKAISDTGFYAIEVTNARTAPSYTYAYADGTVAPYSGL